MDQDDVLLRLAANCAEAYRHWSEALRRPWRVDDDLVLADLGLPSSLPPNNATTLEPLTPDRVQDVVERIRSFFDERPGGGYQVWSAWPTPDLSTQGFVPWRVPCMMRDAGGEPRPAPVELEIAEARDDESMRQAGTLIGDAFGVAPAVGGRMMDPALATDAFRVWVGRVEGQPVSTATASVSHGFVGVYAVATAAEARGRGYGEALSWTATLWRPDLPATLQASSMGLPVYERIGYRTIGWFNCWSRERGGS
jgi:GNAT superfamily N-acetyltransferase